MALFVTENVSGLPAIFWNSDGDIDDDDANNLIASGQSFNYTGNLNTNGFLSNFLPGEFKLRVRFEGLGNVADQELPVVSIPFNTAGAAPHSHPILIPVVAGVLPSGIYQVATQLLAESGGIALAFGAANLGTITVQ